MIKSTKFLNNFFIFIIIFIIFFITQTISKNCFSVEPEEFLKNQKQELRARNISKNVRCLVCQNQSIDESSAVIAKDLRIVIRKKIMEGSTDKEIYTFLTDRYGDYILLKPPLKISTYVLWFFPFTLLFVAVLLIYKHNKKSNQKN